VKITIVLPTYNEAENLPKLVSALFMLPLDLSVLVVDDNSPDGTGEIAENLSSTYGGRISVLHRAGKLGLQSAYSEGFYKAFDLGAEAVVQMDADFSHNPEVLKEMARLIKDCDVVIGSRYIKVVRWMNAGHFGASCYLLLGIIMRGQSCASRCVM